MGLWQQARSKKWGPPGSSHDAPPAAGRAGGYSALTTPPHGRMARDGPRPPGQLQGDKRLERSPPVEVKGGGPAFRPPAELRAYNTSRTSTVSRPAASSQPGMDSCLVSAPGPQEQHVPLTSPESPPARGKDYRSFMRGWRAHPWAGRPRPEGAGLGSPQPGRACRRHARGGCTRETAIRPERS